MNDTLFRPYPRRSRCDIPGCRAFAQFQIGDRPNRPLLLLCDAHARKLQGSLSSIMNREYYAGNQYDTKKKEPVEEVVEEKTAAPEEVPAEAPKKRGRPPKEKKEEKPEIVEPESASEKLEGHEYYTCKHCGKHFDKETVTLSEFMQHSKRCKKVSTDVGTGD